MHVSMVPKEHIEQVRGVCTKYVERVEKYSGGRFTAEDLINKCKWGEANLLIAFDDTGEIYGCLVFSIVPYTRKTMLRITALAGKKLKLWKDDMYKLVETIGKTEECDGQEWCGRAGWIKLFPDMVPTAVLMEKDY